MIRTLAWKELREHLGIWLTMVFMTVVLGLGLAKIVSLEDASLAVPVAGLTILGMAATYGVVCGALMIAGEHEGGTLVFLDIFLGRRGLLWTGKLAIGVVLVVSQALTVAFALHLLRQEPPGWAMRLMGAEDLRGADPSLWFRFLPIVSLEAFAWGMLGSALMQRVLSGAAVGAIGVIPLTLLGIVSDPGFYFGLQLVAAAGVLIVSYSNFTNPVQEPLAGPAPPARSEPLDSRDRFLRLWEEFAREDELFEERPARPTPVTPPAPTLVPDWTRAAPARCPVESQGRQVPQAKSPTEVLWWLTLRQAQPVLAAMTVVSVVAGIIIPANVQVLWPLATLLLGVCCGVAAFAPEQRDLSYQFLAAQHFPLQVIWRFKIVFWLAVAVIEAFVMFFGMVSVAAVGGFKRPPQPGAAVLLDGALPDIMGPLLFLGIWLIYGFCAGQVIVWLCRKTILALLISVMVSAAALGVWMPSVLCGGVAGWQVWLTPLTLLLATSFLIRAWAGGRIQERKPLAALLGFGTAGLAWALVVFGVRAWQVSDVEQPMDIAAYRASLPSAKDNPAGKAIQQAIAKFDAADEKGKGLAFWEPKWLPPLAEAAHMPIGVVEMPRGDGQAPVSRHLSTCKDMSAALLRLAAARKPKPALENLVQVLALSRNLRNKAPIESYLSGVRLESDALAGLDAWLTRGKPDPALLRQALAELNRHARETPPPLDCVQTECFQSARLVGTASTWTFAAAGPQGLPRWFAGSVALSLDAPWEAERKQRIWRTVWLGLIRGIETPHWQLPEPSDDPATTKPATPRIMQGWLPDSEGRRAARDRADVVRLLDTSWLADERLFCSIVPLRSTATRARWNVDGMRLALALSLYRLDHGKAAATLADLTPKYLPAVPIDPYSGNPPGYRIAPPNDREMIWSTGPDRIDHGGHNDGGHLADDDPRWPHGDFDLIVLAPCWA